MSEKRKLVVYVSEEMPQSRELTEAINEIRGEDPKVSVEVQYVEEMEESPVSTTPSVCLVDEETQRPIKCVTGSQSKEEYKTKIKAMLGSQVVV